MRARLKHEKLRQELAKSHRSQNAWAQKLGVSRGHLSLLANGKRLYPSGKTREKLLAALNLTFEDLFEIELPSRRSRALPNGAPELMRPPGAKKGDPYVQSFVQDIRFTFRMWRDNPGFALLAILVLALGIGANTAVFGFVNALFLRPLPFPEPDRLVRVYGAPADGARFGTISYANYSDLRDHNDAFSSLAAHSYATMGLGAAAEVEPLRGEVVSGNYFSSLGVQALLGRALVPDDDRSLGAHPVVVISHALWNRRFGATSDVVGRAILLNGYPFTVVGVAPEWFKGSYDMYSSDVWAPIMMYEQVRPTGGSLYNRGWGWLHVTGRLETGVRFEQASAEMHRVARLLQQSEPELNRGFDVEIFPASTLPESFRGGVSGFLGALAAMVGLVLMVASANIASVTLSRTVRRRREMALRQSLGATHSRLLRQGLTESLSLALVGGAAGLIVAVWTERALSGLSVPGGVVADFAPDLQLDGRVLAFTLAASLITAVVFGLVPAWRAGKEGGAAALREAGTPSSGRWSAVWQRAFVVSQVAVCTLILIAAGLLFRSLREAQLFDPGFDTENLLVTEINLTAPEYTEGRGRLFYQQLVERVESLPGAGNVTLASMVPLGGTRDSLGVGIDGHEPPPGRSRISIAFNVVGPGYFSTMKIPLIWGRDFDERDARAGAPPVIIINETMAARFWPGESAVGQYIEVDGRAEVIGVAQDIQYFSFGEEPVPFMYSSLSQYFFANMFLHVRTTSDPAGIARSVKGEIAELDPKIVLSSSMTFAELRRIPLFPSIAMAMFSSLFGTLTLILSAVGVYGLLSYTVSGRTREIGIRMALGASRRVVFREVLRSGMGFALTGVVLGLIAAGFATRLLESQLFQVSPTDAATFLTVAAILLGAALMACALPARRATRVEPVEALRYE